MKNTQPIALNKEGFDKDFSMDPDEYQHIIDLAESGEFVDFGIPSDAPEGKRISSEGNKSPDQAEFIPINMEDEFPDR